MWRKLDLQMTRTTIVSAIAVSMAKANARLFFSMLMPPGHKTGSNTDQSKKIKKTAQGH